jgi:ubiquinone/menaquinone biosynthesis C-methylase UbiE
MNYAAPSTYARLIARRYGPIADALVEDARLRERDDVLELGAGTGVVTKRATPRVRSLVATDISAPMLAVARETVRRSPGLTFALVDYEQPLPFLDSSFDLVLSGLTYVQDSPRALTEVARVLKPSGRLALAMWGPAYHEFRLLSDALEAIGRPRLPSPAPGRAVQRLERAGFRSVKRRDVELVNDFESVDEYIAYRRGFGMPSGWTRPAYDRFLRTVHREASRDVEENGVFRLGWTITVVAGRRPKDE